LRRLAVAALNLPAKVYGVLLISPPLHWSRVQELVLVLVLVQWQQRMRLGEVVAKPARMKNEMQPVLEPVTLRELTRVLEFGWTPVYSCRWS